MFISKILQNASFMLSIFLPTTKLSRLNDRILKYLGYTTKQFCTIMLVLISSSAVSASQCNIHTWHHIYALNGEWKVTLKVINQNGFFVDGNCNPLETDFARYNHPLEYGFGFSSDSTFDIAYAVTAVKQTKQAFQSPTCVFVVSATGPSQPEVTALSYQGAHCEWKKVARAGGDIYLT